MDVLWAADELDLPNWWIGAGFLRNKIWNALEDKPSEVSQDVDLVYFDKDNVDPEIDWALDKKMQDKYPFAEWEVRNQARMHYKNGLDPFKSTEDGIATLGGNGDLYCCKETCRRTSIPLVLWS